METFLLAGGAYIDPQTMGIAGREFLHQVSRAICAAVVHYQDVPTVRLVAKIGDNSVQSRQDAPFLVVGGDDNGEEGGLLRSGG